MGQFLYNELTNNNTLPKTQNFEPLNDVALNDDWAIPSVLMGGLGLVKLGAEPLLNYSKGLALSYGKPLFRLFDKSLNTFGKLGKDYFRKNIKNTKDYSKILNEYVYYPDSQIGKIRYKYLDQLPKLKQNVRNSNFNRHIDNKYFRQDAKGFDNLKVNFKGNDYAYQIRNNAINGHKEFYNIKPYKYVEEDYQNQYFNKLFKNLLDDGY